MRAEQRRIARLQAMIAEIRAAATGHERATAADLYEARIAVAALDTSEATYAEFAMLAHATQQATLAVLDKLHNEATDREAAEAQRRAEVERVLSIPLPLTIPEEITEGQNSQQVLKAEPATADATDRDAPAATSPCVGTMGVGQPADAGPAAETGHAQEVAQEEAYQQDHGNPPAGADCTGCSAQPALQAPTLTLGKINEWLSPLKIDAAGLELLGFTAVKVHNAKLYNDTDRPAIVAALVKHLQGL
jgi:hypothetical protein